MKRLFVTLPLLACAPAVAASDTGSGVVTLGPQPEAQQQTCVEVEIGGARASSFDCLNQRLARQVDAARPAPSVAPLDAASPAVKVGGFNETAMSQQFGQNWGRSTIPYRPPTPVFGNAIHP